MGLEILHRRIRDRRARRLLDRARSRDPAELTGIVPDLEAIVSADDGSAQFTAVRALAAVARSDQSHPVRDSATDALIEALATGTESLQAAVGPELRYVALERPAIVPRLDQPYADILLAPGTHASRRVAIDVGILTAVHGPETQLSGAREALQETLLGGTGPDRRAAGIAYVLMAGTPSVTDDPGPIAEHLAILRGELEVEQLPQKPHLQRLADGRTLDDAIVAYARVDRSRTEPTR